MQPNFKYPSSKKCLLGLVLLIYLAGTLNQGLLEIVHALSHNFTGGHSYYSHHTDLVDASHEHIILDLSKIAFENSSHTPIKKDVRLQLSIDKIPQICPSVAFQLSLGEQKNKNNLFFNLQIPPTPFLQSITPPPDFTI